WRGAVGNNDPLHNLSGGPWCKLIERLCAVAMRRQPLTRESSPLLLSAGPDDGLSGASMASDIFAKLGDIKGESTDDKHKDEIEVLSYSWGLANPARIGAGGGGGAGKATFQDLSFHHAIDKASPLLMKACATGLHLKEATITHRKAGK